MSDAAWIPAWHSALSALWARNKAFQLRAPSAVRQVPSQWGWKCLQRPACLTRDGEGGRRELLLVWGLHTLVLSSRPIQAQ